MAASRAADEHRLAFAKQGAVSLSGATRRLARNWRLKLRESGIEAEYWRADVALR